MQCPWCHPYAQTSHQIGEPDQGKFPLLYTLCPIISQHLLDIDKSDNMLFPAPNNFPHFFVKLLPFFTLHLSHCFTHFYFRKLYNSLDFHKSAQ